MHKYDIYSGEKLVIQYLSGDITLDDFKETCESISGDSRFSPEYSIVVDFRDSRLLFSLEELKEAAEIYLHYDCFKGPKVLVVNKSVDTAKIMIYRNHLGTDHRFFIYSTVSGASSFLQLDLSRYIEEEDSFREDFYIDPSRKKTRSSDPLPVPNNLS